MIADLVQRVERRFYGKYRGFVVSNDDPLSLGRLTLRVPSVLGPDVITGWAMPCAPFGGFENGGFLAVPKRDDGVWVEFEEGDIEFPIWIGTFWSRPGGNSEVPRPNNADGSEQARAQRPPTRKILKTDKGHTLQFEDKDGEEMITLVEATHGHVVTMDANGIQISDGANGNKLVMGPDGIRIGSDEAKEAFVLGNQFMDNVTDFISALNKHTHPVPNGTSETPMNPIQLKVPLSAKHRVE